jgi:hypothetical protein
MAPIREEEARYRVMELVKRRPNLTTLLFNCYGRARSGARHWKSFRRPRIKAPTGHRASPACHCFPSCGLVRHYCG